MHVKCRHRYNLQKRHPATNKTGVEIANNFIRDSKRQIYGALLFTKRLAGTARKSTQATVMNRMRICTVLVLAGSLLGSGWAQAITSPQTIQSAVHHHMDKLLKQHRLSNNNQQRIEFEVARIDPNLRMPSCTKKLTLKKNEPRLLGRVSIRVRCDGSNPWQIYVPVTVKAYQKVVTAAAPLAREQRLDKSVIELTEKDVSRLTQGYFSSVSEVLGKSLKRPVSLNGVIQPNMVVEAMVIKRGDEVMIIAKVGTLSVKSHGIAVNNGRVGQQIQVKNKASKRVITARVINSALVEVVM